MSRKLTIKLPIIVGTQEYEPTGLQIQVLCAYIEAINAKEQAEPIRLLKAMAKAPTNWYNWLKKNGFMQWWNQAIEEYFTGHGLSEVHSAIYRRALGNSSQDAKIFLERFDKEYKPTTREERTFPGLEPPEDIPGAIERSKERAKLVASEVIETDATAATDKL